jgi:hypothetical protein
MKIGAARCISAVLRQIEQWETVLALGFERLSAN